MGFTLIPIITAKSRAKGLVLETTMDCGGLKLGDLPLISKIYMIILRKSNLKQEPRDIFFLQTYSNILSMFKDLSMTSLSYSSPPSNSNEGLSLVLVFSTLYFS